MRRNDPSGREGNDQQHRGNARMSGPGQCRGEDHVDHRLRRDHAHQQTQAGHVLVGRDDRQELLQGEQHQPKPDRDPAEIMRPRLPAVAEQDDPDQHETRRRQADIEGQELHDQRGAEIGAEHDGERRHQIDEPARGEARRHQPGRGAALQYRGDAEPGEERAPAVAEGASEQAPQIGSEGALDAALHHVQAPQQQRNRAGEIDQG